MEMNGHSVHLRRAAGAILGAAMLAGGLSPAYGDDDDARGAGAAAPIPRAVQLTAERQQLAGIRTVIAEASAVSAEIEAFGTVVDLRPLLALRSDQARIRAELEIARAAQQKSGRELARMRTLHGDAGNISARQLQDAQAAHAMDTARVQAAESQLSDTLTQARLGWGDVLSEAALETGGSGFEPLAGGRDALLLVSVPGNGELPAGIDTVYVSRDGQRGSAATARLLSAAPFADGTSQGATFFFSTARNDLRTGMRVRAWIPSGGAPVPIVRAPSSAVIWHDGRPWVYLRGVNGLFTRVAVSAYRLDGDDWLIETPALSGLELVVSGGQALLAEEYRWRIPDEDDDP